MIKISRAQFHNTIFVAKKNIKDKVTFKLNEIEMFYDRQHKEMLVIVDNQGLIETAIVPYTNINYMVAHVEVPKADKEENLLLSPQIPFKSAQVDTPQSHVHKGAGYGKMR